MRGTIQTNPDWAVGMWVPPSGPLTAAEQIAAGPYYATQGITPSLGPATGNPQYDWATGQWVVGEPGTTNYIPYAPAGTGGGGGVTYPTEQSAASRAATMLYNAMRGLPFISPEFLSALQAGQAPAPRTVTPQTLAALSADSTLSDAFFSVIKANALYPASYLAEIGRYIPRGREATPSFI